VTGIEHEPVPDQQTFIQRDQLTQYAGKAREKYRICSWKNAFLQFICFSAIASFEKSHGQHICILHPVA